MTGKLDEKDRAKKDLDKLDRIVVEFKGLGLDKKYPQVMEWVTNYSNDAKHYFEKGDYFTSFGAAFPRSDRKEVESPRDQEVVFGLTSTNAV